MGSESTNEQKVAIVTGSTSGIGYWVAENIHRRGYRVAIVGRRKTEGEQIASSLDPTGNTAIFVACDVASYDSQANLFRTVWNKWSRLDVVIANAGIVDQGSVYNFRYRDAAVTDIPPPPDLTCTDVDWKGTVYTTTLATHFMRHNNPVKGGKIILTGSILGVHPAPLFPEYCPVKAAVLMFARAMAPQLLRKDGVTINVVLPGPVDTAAMPDFATAFRPEHLGTRAAVLGAYDEFLLGDAANRKTGQAVEIAHDRLLYHDAAPAFRAGDVSRRATQAYEPWFARMHGEPSGLPDAIRLPQDQQQVVPLPTAAAANTDTTTKILAVLGATGAQGGGVVNVMRTTPGWRVRALTRDPDGAAARKLAAQDGVEVVRADLDDEASLVRAFEGATAVFAVTNWWEHLFRGQTAAEARAREEAQGRAAARAAARTPGLAHYLWSTTPSAARATGGALAVPHMEGKAAVDAYLKAELPALAARTTYLYFGFYPQNLAFLPLLQPVFHQATNTYIQLLPTPPSARILHAGDMAVNPGLWVRGALASAPRSFGRYANVAGEKLSFAEMLRAWAEAVGAQRPARVVQCAPEAWEQLHGPAAAELALQFRFGERCDPWAEDEERFISAAELGIDEREVVGFKGAIERLKSCFD
ncbi:hypothetical protein F4780DRAFT_540258 [Xylariomycetidae sp. FL0641]|nr:hypothetical protein F4780DRAFT_540258 [Xylariomycetidae sp. FL0641]